MSADSIILAALNPLAIGGAWADITPEETELPYITFQQVGGDSDNFLDQSIPSQRNARFQVNVWATTRQQASELAVQVENALRLADLQTTVLGAPVSQYEPDIQIYGTRQDFSVWA